MREHFTDVVFVGFSMMHQSSANLVILSKSSSSNLIESLFSKTVNREVSSANSLILQFISLTVSLI